MNDPIGQFDDDPEPHQWLCRSPIATNGPEETPEAESDDEEICDQKSALTIT